MRCLLIGALCVFTSVAAWAQGPWISSVIPRTGPPVMETLMSPSAQVVWGINTVPVNSVFDEYTVFCSADGGQSFQTYKEIDPGIVDVWGIDGQRAWGITANTTFTNNSLRGLLLSTTTGPGGFSVVRSAPNAKFRFVRFVNATNGILVGIPATGATTWPLFWTTNGGTTWASATTLAIVAGDYPTNCTQADGVTWVSTRLGYVLRSTDGGQTWSSSNTGLGNSLREVCFRNASNGLAFGTAGQLRSSGDGGQTWTLVTPQGPLHLNCAVAIPGSAGTYLTGAGQFGSTLSGTSISTDNGATWVGLESSIFMLRLAASGTQGVYGCGLDRNNGYRGNLYRYNGVLSTRTKPQVVKSLCFPNPATEVLHLPAADHARTARLYDVAGRLQRSWQVGRGEQVLSLTGVAAGSYQLQLTEQDQAVRVQHIVVQR